VRTPNRHFAVGLARAFGGAIVFSLPMLMTAEMWWLGYYMARWRLLLLLLLWIPLLIRLAYYAGFEETTSFTDDAVDAFVALAVGFVSSGLILALFNVLRPGVSFSALTAILTLQAIPASIGAMLAQSQLGQREEENQRPEPGYWGELLLMAVGAIFLAFNIAPTDEIVLLAGKMMIWHSIALIGISLLLMHGFVYAVEFRGATKLPETVSQLRAFGRFTVPGYALVLVISFYSLWTFGRMDGVGLTPALMQTVVLAFPAAIGAASARLIL
jgi:putative integral membrane protein (TIGR02587 family)